MPPHMVNWFLGLPALIPPASSALNLPDNLVYRPVGNSGDWDLEDVVWG